MRKRILPQVPWAATSFWSPKPLPLLVSCIALFMFGVGDGLLLQSALGNSPWTIFAQGLALHTPFSVGGASLATSIIILAITIAMRIPMGLNTFLNAILIALALDIVNKTVPIPDSLTMRLVMCCAGIVIAGIAGAFYLSVNMGAGPRDGLMVAISQHFGWPIAWSRTLLEVFACVTGYLMGGQFGLGTILFAISIGHVLSFTMRIFAKQFSQVHD